MSPTTEYRQYRYRPPGAGLPPPSDRKPAVAVSKAQDSTGSKRHPCPRCRPVVHAHFHDGELVSVQLHHQWKTACGGAIEALELDDWIDHATNYPPRDPQAIRLDNTPDDPAPPRRGPRPHTEPRRRARKATT